MIDSHCHLDFLDFDSDRAEVITRAKKVGVGKILNPGCNLVTSRRAVKLADQTEEIFAAVGVHPHDAREVTDIALAELEQLATSPKVVAIGEIGLDYFRIKKTENRRQIIQIQQEAFRSQLELAQKLDKPVIIHSREADEDILKILDGFKNLRGVFHCFGGGIEFAKKILAKGFYLGFTGICTFPRAENIREVIRLTSLDKILVETDAPYLAPESVRGKRNEPAFAVEVAQKIAELKGVSVEEVARMTTKNSENLFHFWQLEVPLLWWQSGYLGL